MTDKNTSIIYAGGTDIGRVRQQNQDSILMAGFKHSDAVLLLVADGVGGHKGGEVASKLAVDTMQAYVAKAIMLAQSGGGYSADWLILTLKNAIADANLKIMEQQKINPDLSDMATTIVAMFIHGKEVAISHLGDSRCYQFFQNSFKQLTEDHTMLQKLLNEGKIKQHEFEVMPMHHIISQAIGLVDNPDIQTSRLEFKQNLIYLLCSDGLTNCVSDEQIQIILEKNEFLESAVDELITKANDNGGVDNISVVLVKSGTQDI